MKQKASRQTVGTLLTIGGGVCWGISGCMAQYLFESKAVTAIWLVPQRMVVAGLILVVLGFFVEGKKMVAIFWNRADLIRLLVFSVFGMMSCQLAYFSAVQYSNAGTATVLQTLAPVFILLFYCLRYRRRPRRVELIAIAGALLGTFLLATHGQLNGLAITPQGLFFGLGAGVGAALYTLLSASLLNKGYSTWTVVGLGMFFSGLLLAAIVRPWSMEVVWDSEMMWMFVGIVTIGTALAFSLFLAGASIVGPLKASLLGSVEPLTAILLSTVVLGASFTAWDFIGFVLILGIVAMLSLSKGQKAD